MTDTSLLILGTAAAEGIPAYFCNCRVCREAAAKGGKEIRGRSSYNFGGVIQVDFGPDMLQAFQRFYPRLNRMRHLLITHAHEDHLSPSELWFRSPGFRQIPDDEPPLTIHGNGASLGRIVRDAAPTMTGLAARSRIPSRMHVALHEIGAFESFDLPDVGATVRTFAADHDATLDPMLFLITMGGRTILIGNDTGLFPEATKVALRALGGSVHIDVAVLDCCGGLLKGWEHGHMCAESNLVTFEELDGFGLTDSKTQRIVNHFSHNGNATHEELCAFFEPKGISVAYDGMEI